MKTWRHALRNWLQNGIHTEFVRRCAINYCFVLLPPEGIIFPPITWKKNSDNDIDSDLEIDWDEDDLAQAITTRVKGAGKQDKNQPVTTLHAMTMQAFDLSSQFWLPDDSTHVSTALDPNAAVIASNEVFDANDAIQSAKASRSKQNADAHHIMNKTEIQASVKPLKSISAAGIQTWLQSNHVKEGLNKEQHEFMSVVVDRALAELGLQDQLDKKERRIDDRKDTTTHHVAKPQQPRQPPPPTDKEEGHKGLQT